jgi:hypothetical protein
MFLSSPEVFFATLLDSSQYQDPHTADATTDNEFLRVVKSRPNPATAASAPKAKTMSLVLRDISLPHYYALQAAGQS